MMNSTKTKNNREYLIIMLLFVGIFAGLSIYFAHYIYAESDTFINSSYNTRTDILEELVTRGSIYSSDGETLAETVKDEEGNEYRKYPAGRICAHIVGYSTFGNSGIESLANILLLRSNINQGQVAINEITGEKSPGDSVTTTLNYELQLRAYDALGEYDGAVVVMEPSTGKILAMVSKPDFEPNTIADDWKIVNSEDDSPLLNRATQGLYPPGSTFKIFTTLEYMRENSDYNEYLYDCQGKITINDLTIHCYSNKHHGSVDLEDSFAHSCNSSFANIGSTLDPDSFRETCESLLFNSELPTALEYNESSFDLSSSDSLGTLMETAIGQGKTTVSPFHMALIASAIDNGGVLMNPMILQSVNDDNGNLVKSYSTSTYGTLMTEEEAATLKEYMSDVVQNGTATKLKGAEYDAYGKTGSAETDSSSKAHSWFVGFAHEDGKEDIAVAIIVENSGMGSDYAVPIAKEIFDEYYSEYFGQ